VPTLRAEKVNEVGLNETGNTPVPVVVTTCGLSGALSVITTDPVLVPVVVGVKVTEMVHFFPAGTEVPHVFV